jgi:putative CocE/NonD family hydrolase
MSNDFPASINSLSSAHAAALSTAAASVKKTVKWIPRSYRVIKEVNVPARTRDGLTLFADVYRPDAPGKFPVILMRTPYNKSDPILGPMGRERLASLGYILVVQDCRARFMSEGDWYHPMVHEAVDGYDAVEWAARLPWSDGNVGMAGQSALGMTQYLTAPTRPPHLRTMFAVSSPSDWHECWVYRGAGVLDFRWLIAYCLIMTPDQLARKGTQHLLETIRNYYPDPGNMNVGPLKDEHYCHLPIYDWVERLKDSVPYMRDYLDHPEYDAYWEHIDVKRKAHEISVPIFHVTSWYDGFLPGSLNLFANIRESGMTPEARSGQRLLVGPWNHILYWNPTSSAGDVDFGPEAMIRINDMEQQWFDYWLKGIDTGIKDQRPIQIFVMGDNVWREEDEWPLARTKWTPYYIHSQGGANTLNGNGTLSRVPPQAERTDSFVYDPNDPVPTKGGSMLGLISTGPYDQQEVEARQDVLVYTSEPLVEDLEITGPLIVKLFAASTATDTDFTAKLLDVRPNGYAQNLQDGIIRARYRLTGEHSTPIAPGEVYEYTINLWAISQVIKAGHRIRLEISSSNFPLYDRNPNTGGPLFKEKDLKTATQTIFHDAAHLSHVVLPIITR